MRRPLLDQSHGAIAQSFLRSLIKFPGIAKLHQPNLSDLFHYVIYLFGILVKIKKRQMYGRAKVDLLEARLIGGA
jgi:hypothetical protein